MNIEATVPNVTYKEVINYGSNAKIQSASHHKPVDKSTASSRNGILPGISSDFRSKSYPELEKVTLGGKIDIRW